MPVVETLAPLILLIALGALLARIQFLGPQFMADLNKLAFWVALPALLFHAASHAGEPGREVAELIGVLIFSTVLISAIAGGIAILLHMPSGAMGTLIQSAFRGNLAYIGLPVLLYSLGDAPEEDAKETLATGVVVMTLLMAFFNVLAVIVLQSGAQTGGRGLGSILRLISTNPLLIAGLTGLAVGMTGLPLPLSLDRAIEAMGGAAVPIALICIGGALATTSFHGRKSWILIAALLKVAALPILVELTGQFLGMDHSEMRIALIFSACPTAAAAFVMARQMGGDEALASGSITVSTIFSAISLAVVLWLTGG